MKKTIPRVTPVILALGISLIFASGAHAHHGWSGYDETKPLSLTGTIRDSGYDNPHGFVELEVAGNPAKTWHVVLAPPSRMETRGLPKELLKTGANRHRGWLPGKDQTRRSSRRAHHHRREDHRAPLIKHSWPRRSTRGWAALT
jgi:hypothetical protein